MKVIINVCSESLTIGLSMRVRLGLISTQCNLQSLSSNVAAPTTYNSTSYNQPDASLAPSSIEFTKRSPKPQKKNRPRSGDVSALMRKLKPSKSDTDSSSTRAGDGNADTQCKLARNALLPRWWSMPWFLTSHFYFSE